MKKNIIAGIVAAVVVATGTGAVAYNIGHTTGSTSAAIENAYEMGVLESQADGIIQEQTAKTQKAVSNLTDARQKAIDQYNAARKANNEKAEAEKKAAEEQAAREKAEAEKKAAEEKANKEAEEAKEAANLAEKIGIKQAIRHELTANSTDGRLTQDSIDYIKGLLSTSKANGYHITFTANDINSMELDDTDAALLGLEIVG